MPLGQFAVFEMARYLKIIQPSGHTGLLGSINSITFIVRKFAHDRQCERESVSEWVFLLQLTVCVLNNRDMVYQCLLCVRQMTTQVPVRPSVRPSVRPFVRSCVRCLFTLLGKQKCLKKSFFEKCFSFLHVNESGH